MNHESVPTRPNNTQYSPANIGKGMDAKIAPNFPVSRIHFEQRRKFVSLVQFSSRNRRQLA